MLSIRNIEDKEAEALAHYRASQQRTEEPEGAASPRRSARRLDASAERDHVGQPMPRGSRLPNRQSGDAATRSVTYTVQRGDTLRGIAEWFYGDRSRSLAIQAANRSTIRDPEAIEAGMELIIPRRGGAQPLA